MKFTKDIFDGDYQISQKFGENPQIYKQFGLKGHNGCDFALPNGVEVYAALDGIVLEAKDQGKGGYGRYVRLGHSGGAQTLYGHFRDFEVAQGDSVKKGQLLGHSDNTGFSTGPHLHFGFRPPNFDINNGYNGWIDPLPYWKEDIPGMEDNQPVSNTGGGEDQCPAEVKQDRYHHGYWKHLLRWCENWKDRVARNQDWGDLMNELENCQEKKDKLDWWWQTLLGHNIKDHGDYGERLKRDLIDSVVEAATSPEHQELLVIRESVRRGELVSQQKLIEAGIAIQELQTKVKEWQDKAQELADGLTRIHKNWDEQESKYKKQIEDLQIELAKKPEKVEVKVPTQNMSNWELFWLAITRIWGKIKNVKRNLAKVKKD